MADVPDCEKRASDYLFMAEAKTDQELKAVLLSMWRNWLLIGQLERIDALRRQRCHCGGSIPRIAPRFVTAWVFATLVRAEARGGWLRENASRGIREFLYERLGRRVQTKQAVAPVFVQQRRGRLGEPQRRPSFFCCSRRSNDNGDHLTGMLRRSNQLLTMLPYICPGKGRAHDLTSYLTRATMMRIREVMLAITAGALGAFGVFFVASGFQTTDTNWANQSCASKGFCIHSEFIGIGALLLVATVLVWRELRSEARHGSAQRTGRRDSGLRAGRPARAAASSSGSTLRRRWSDL
jgi:hypothetical protein